MAWGAREKLILQRQNLFCWQNLAWAEELSALLLRSNLNSKKKHKKAPSLHGRGALKNNALWRQRLKGSNAHLRRWQRGHRGEYLS